MDISSEEINWIKEEVNLEEIRDKLKQQADFYRESNMKIKNVLMKLNLLKEDLSLESQNELSKLVDLQETFQSKECKSEALALSHIDQLRKQNLYIAKVKTCRKMYINLNEKLAKEIKRLKSEYEHSRNKVNHLFQVSSSELKEHEIKIKRYEEQLAKFEEKYPWLKNPELNLNHISKEIQSLNNLKQKKLNLIQELEVYSGLKPDITEAQQQLDDIKKKYEELNKSFQYKPIHKTFQ